MLVRDSQVLGVALITAPNHVTILCHKPVVLDHDYSENTQSNGRHGGCVLAESELAWAL